MSNQTDNITIEPELTQEERRRYSPLETFDLAQALTQADPRLPFPAAPFNDKAALHQIFAKEDEITQLARAFNDADERRKKAKLALDQAHEQLSAMIAVIRVREEERRDELEHADDLSAALSAALATRETTMPPDLIAQWSPEERAAVFAWASFDDPGQAPPPLPFVLASSHVAGSSPVTDKGIPPPPLHCTECDAVIPDAPPGWFVGTGCPGKPKAEPEQAPRRRKRDAQ